MTRLVTEGFEYGDIGSLAVLAGCTIVAGPALGGVYSLRITNNALGASYGFTAVAEMYYKGYFQYATAGTSRIVRWDSAGTELGSIRLNVAGKIDLYNTASALAVAGTKALSGGVWYLLELRVKIADAGGVIELKIDGVVDSTFSGDTKPGAQTTIDAFVLPNNIITAGVYLYHDDIAVNSTAGGADNGYPGDGRIKRLGPDGNGDVTQLEGSDGNQVDNYLLVDEVPHNGDTDYVYDTVIDQYDLYNLAASGLGSAAILRVWGEARAYGAAGDKIAFVTKTVATEYTSADVNLPTSYGAVKEPERTVNPNTGTAWTVAQLDALQVGPRVR